MQHIRLSFLFIYCITLALSVITYIIFREHQTYTSSFQYSYLEHYLMTSLYQQQFAQLAGRLMHRWRKAMHYVNHQRWKKTQRLGKPRFTLL